MSIATTTIQAPQRISEAAHERPTQVIDGSHELIAEPDALLDWQLRSRAVPAESVTPGSYVVLDGAPEALVRLQDEITHIGRGLASTLRLHDHRVSRRHAIIVKGGGQVRLIDDRSTNGTFLNGRRIDDAELRDGDVITVGPVALRYIEAKEPARRALARPQRGAPQASTRPRNLRRPSARNAMQKHTSTG
jgi:hypothetical protein